MGQTYISKLENGRLNVSIEQLAVIAEALGVKLAELVQDDN